MTAAVPEIKINKEYAKLVYPLTELEYNTFKESIKEKGQWIPIVVNEGGSILDGHHRFKASGELDIKPITEVKRFDSQIEEKIFVIESNLKRRQLNDFQRAELGYGLEEVYGEKAKLRQLSALKKGNKVPSVSNDTNGEKGRTAQLIAARIGISTSKYNRSKKIIDQGTEDQKKKLRGGKSTVNKEYHIVSREERRKEHFKTWEQERLERKQKQERDYIFVYSTSGKTHLELPKLLTWSDEEIEECREVYGSSDEDIEEMRRADWSDVDLEDLKQQLDEREKPNWWLSEEEKQKEIQLGKEYEEFDKRYREKYLEKDWASKKEIIDWLSLIDDSVRFSVGIYYRGRFPPRPPRPLEPQGHFKFRDKK